MRDKRVVLEIIKEDGVWWGVRRPAITLSDTKLGPIPPGFQRVAYDQCTSFVDTQGQIDELDIDVMKLPRCKIPCTPCANSEFVCRCEVEVITRKCRICIRRRSTCSAFEPTAHEDIGLNETGTMFKELNITAYPMGQRFRLPGDPAIANCDKSNAKVRKHRLNHTSLLWMLPLTEQHQSIPPPPQVFALDAPPLDDQHLIDPALTDQGLTNYILVGDSSPYDMSKPIKLHKGRTTRTPHKATHRTQLALSHSHNTIAAPPCTKFPWYSQTEAAPARHTSLAVAALQAAPQ